ATGPEPTRRALLLAAAAACLRADSADDVWAVLSSMAAGLSAAHAQEFLAAIDKAMPGYQDLRTNVTALLAQSDVQSSIELVDNTGDDRKRTVEVDWLLRIKASDGVSVTVNRQEHVRCTFERQAKSWRIVALSPLSLFAPEK